MAFHIRLLGENPLIPLVGRVPTARPLGKCSVGDLQKPCKKQAVNGLLFLLAKKVAKYILPPLTACFLHDNKSAPTGKCSRGFEPPLWGGGESQWGDFRRKISVHFLQIYYSKNARSKNRSRTYSTILSCTYT